MPKQTFFNLSDEKRKKISMMLVNTFKEKPFKEVTVKEIVEKLDIPRGSFYQYFNSLNEAYFYILEQEISEIHESFIILVQENNMDVITALDLFGEIVADKIFQDKSYALYRNLYLYHDSALEKEWRLYRRNNKQYGVNILTIAEKEKVMFIGAIIHSLIQRLFIESWSRETFMNCYKIYVDWIKRGIE